MYNDSKEKVYFYYNYTGKVIRSSGSFHICKHLETQTDGNSAIFNLRLSKLPQKWSLSQPAKWEKNREEHQVGGFYGLDLKVTHIISAHILSPRNSVTCSHLTMNIMLFKEKFIKMV